LNGASTKTTIEEDGTWDAGRTDAGKMVEALVAVIVMTGIIVATIIPLGIAIAGR
jgi:hypothetical protein